MTGICIVDGCTNRWKSRQLCDMHYGRQWTRLHAYGAWQSNHIDAAPVRDHILKLRAAGISNMRLRDLTGVSHNTIQVIVTGRPQRGHGPTKRVLRRTAAKILAVPVPARWWEQAKPSHKGDATGATRRLQALVAMGYTQSELSRRLGWLPTNGSRVIQGRGGCTAHTARRVAALYDELSMTPPTGASRTVALAHSRAWLPPLAWDDETIDDPNAQPALDESDYQSRLMLSRWWRTQSCTEPGCDRRRVGLGSTWCSHHRQVLRNAS